MLCSTAAAIGRRLCSTAAAPPCKSTSMPLLNIVLHEPQIPPNTGTAARSKACSQQPLRPPTRLIRAAYSAYSTAFGRPGTIGRLALATRCRLHLVGRLGFSLDEKGFRREARPRSSPSLGASFCARAPPGSVCHYTCTACALHVHCMCMCTACALHVHVHCMCTACALHVHVHCVRKCTLQVTLDHAACLALCSACANCRFTSVSRAHQQQGQKSPHSQVSRCPPPTTPEARPLARGCSLGP